ncbi:multicopper oxidase family protein [Paenibacillus oryzisoli]|uniref:multicopper oxidase family protein n=1 Tax=Paenibacillus oryzisoli TaxID=1850517 RepID=UPI003D2CF78D
MVENIFGAAGFTALGLVVLWSAAAYWSSRLPYSASTVHLRRRAIGVVLLLCLGAALAIAKAVLIAAVWPVGWPAMQLKLALELGLFGAPTLAALGVSLPRLLRLARRSRAQRRPLAADERAGTARIALVLPVQAAMLGAVAVLVYTFFTAVPLPVKMIAVPPLLVTAGTALQAVRLQRRTAKLRSPAWAKPRLGLRLLRAAASLVAVAAALWLWLSAASQMSVLPPTLSMAAGVMDTGGAAPAGGHAHDAMGGISVASLNGPRQGEPDKRFTLTAKRQTVSLSSGAQVEAWTFNGQLPGPELRVQQGDLIEVTLINSDITDGVTLHWHGLDVPNAEDGVAGVTQNAVMLGQTHVYRFVAADAGTYWYHSHQESYIGEGKGLFGALIVDPKPAGTEAIGPTVLDIPIVAHTWQGTDNAVSFGTSDGIRIQEAAPGTPVRLRLINTDNDPIAFQLQGTPFRVSAIDGTDLKEPTELRDQELQVATGGRYDVTFTMPEQAVQLLPRSRHEPKEGTRTALVFSTSGRDETAVKPSLKKLPVFDPLAYGRPDPAAVAKLTGSYDRQFTLILDKRLGFYNGKFAFSMTINGKLFPDTPMLMVREGDVVKTTFVNHSTANHPMHLHGHHMLVLSRNGQPSTGSPWWVDTLNVAPGDVYEVAFLADNPGLWMDHCHNLQHASVGMSMHLMYEGVTTPYVMGSATGNHPE